MIIPKETLDAFKAQGIFVSRFPNEEIAREKREEYRRKEEENLRHPVISSWFENGEWKYEYGKEYPNWQERLEEEMARYDNTERIWGPNYDATVVYISKGDILARRTVNKSKVITQEFVDAVLTKEQKAYSGAYGQFAKDVQKMYSKKFGTSRAWIYPTTYGIGVLVFYNLHAEEHVKDVAFILDNSGIEYKNEYSDAFQVYRFKISKKEVNRLRLQKAIS